jgi:hypothetical protein
MPATSAKQKKFMDAAANNPAFAKKVGVPVKVAKEFSKESKGLKFKEGGDMKHSDMKMAKGGRIASKGEHAVQKKSKRGAEMVKMASGGMASKRADGIAIKGKTVGKMLARGGKC